MHADDTTIIFSNQIDARSNTNHSVAILIEWFRSNRQSVNIKKTLLLQFGKRKNGRNRIIWFGKSEVRHTDMIKFLGVDIDSQLNFKSHISRICKKLAKLCGN